ncbi:glutamyl-tRNA reductase [Nevskia sp.]|uniref:glutamyl-tRNA reductase n=1 Tax=Nevskia sp. TaxID=1929292 RepID=UPI0025D206DD|nr:glutamyl-tRNA reductase [Nevskia sp.]
MALLTLGLSHHSAPVETRERLAFTAAEIPDALTRLRALPGVSEAAILSTCNRTEIFAVAAPEEEGRLLDWWQRERQAPAGTVEKHAYVLRDRGTVRHSLRVASGLDSMVLGEPQILGQMKTAFAQAQGVRALGPVLSRLFQHSFSVAKLVRSETEIGAHPVSIAYAAVQMANHIFSDLRNQSVLLIGAGETIQLLARHLKTHGVGRMVVANRSLEKAQALATTLGGYAIGLAELPTHLPEADVVISCTAARGFILGKEPVANAISRRRRKPVLMIDLAIPRDLDPAISGLEDVYLYTLDDLKAVIAGNMKHRENAAKQAEVLVEDQAVHFEKWLESRDAGVTIRRLRDHARVSRDDVLEKARRKLANGESAEAVMAFVADTLTNKLLHAPSKALRSGDAVEQSQLMDAAEKLFDLPPVDA